MNKMANILQMTYYMYFLELKLFYFDSEFNKV